MQKVNALESLEEAVEVVRLAPRELLQRRIDPKMVNAPESPEETVEVEREGVPLVKDQKALISFRTARPFRGHLCRDARQGALSLRA